MFQAKLDQSWDGQRWMIKPSKVVISGEPPVHGSWTARSVPKYMASKQGSHS